MGFHLISKNILLPVEPRGDENVIGIRAFKTLLKLQIICWYYLKRMLVLLDRQKRKMAILYMYYPGFFFFSFQIKVIKRLRLR